MAISNFSSNLDKIIYDPVKGRIVYDSLLSLVFNFLIFVLFWIFENKNQNIIVPVSYSVIFILSNFIQGLYGRNKTTNLRNKILILALSNITALVFLLLLNTQVIQLIFMFILCSIISILPRFFLNFNVERTTFKDLGVSQKKDAPILVVGGGGYIGTELVELLLKNGNKVRVFDKFIYNKNIFKGVKNIKNLELIEGDISDIYSLTLAVKDSKALVHLAGIVGDPAAKIDEELTRHVNIASTRLLKETAKAFGVGKFIFASSCSIYGTSGKLQNENSKPRPISLYAKTKLDSEKELLSDTTDSFHPVILRFSTVFGHSRKPRFDLVVNLFTAQAFYDKKIFVEGGDQWRPFIHVKDVARAIALVLDSPNEKVSRQIFNVGDDDLNITIMDIANIVAKTMNNPRLQISFLNRKKDRRDYQVSFKKIKNLLNYKASVSIEEGIKEIHKNLINKKYIKSYKDSYYVNSEMTKELRKEFHSKKYRKSHFSTIS